MFDEKTGLNYEITGDGNIRITGYHGDSKELDIPSNIDGHTVSTIGTLAFANAEFEKLTIPDTVETIEFKAFAGCRGLAAVKLSNNLKTLGNSAFMQCTSLKNITIPDSVNSFGKTVFLHCGGRGSLVVEYSSNLSNWVSERILEQSKMNTPPCNFTPKFIQKQNSKMTAAIDILNGNATKKSREIVKRDTKTVSKGLFKGIGKKNKDDLSR